MNDLRALLEEMVLRLERDEESTFPERIAKVPGWLEDIRRLVPHTIELQESAAPLETYNCVMHALGLVGLITEYDHPLFLARTDFVRLLIDSEILRPCEPEIGVLITWSTAEKLKHIGRLVAHDRAVSKWGDSFLCEHGLQEVPTRYGTVSGFYTPLKPERALHYLYRAHGISAN